jgi:hypothetical protein
MATLGTTIPKYEKIWTKMSLGCHGLMEVCLFALSFLIIIDGAFVAVVHPHLHFISHVPSTVIGEQLVAQLFRAIPEQQWLFAYGRVPMSFVLAEHMYEVTNLPSLFLMSRYLSASFPYSVSWQ